MTQQDLGLNLSTRRTRKAAFLQEANLVVSRTKLLSLMAPHTPWAKTTTLGVVVEVLERAKASIRAKVEHQFRVIDRQLGYIQVKYRRLTENTANLMALFALSNLWMVRKRLLKMTTQAKERSKKGRESQTKLKSTQNQP